MIPEVHEIVVPVPGRFETGTAFLDLETMKVPIDPPFVMRNGEVLRHRWSIILAGIAMDGKIHLIDGNGERGILNGITNVCDESSEILYAATRQFDEMIVKGRFTNARRAHEERPFYAHAEDAEWWSWRNLGPIPDWARGMRSDTDLPGKGISQRLLVDPWGVRVHLLRDVITLLFMEDARMKGVFDKRCEAWMARVLMEDDFAKHAIFGGK